MLDYLGNPMSSHIQLNSFFYLIRRQIHVRWTKFAYSRNKLHSNIHVYAVCMQLIMIICSLCFPISFIKYLKECNEWQTKPKIAEPYLPVNCAFASQNCHKYAFCCHHYTMRLIDTSYLRKMDKHFCTKYFHRLLLQYNSRLLSHSTPTHRPLTKWPPFPGPFFMNENIIILITICFHGSN